MSEYKRPLIKCKECGEGKPHKAFQLCSKCYDGLKYSKQIGRDREWKKKEKIRKNIRS